MNPSITLSNKQSTIDQIKSEDLFADLKSNFIFKKIFDCLPKNKSLDIIKYNKNLQKRKSITINDFKEYVDLYSPIEIEIIPALNRAGKFITIKDSKYYHIFFNNDNKEIKRNYLKENEDVKIIKIIIDYQVKSLEDLFYKCECIESINFKKFYRTNIPNMNGLFAGCSNLKEINLSKLNTKNVIYMQGMFSECSALKKLNLANFNTFNVINMSHMFAHCSSLEELNLSNFNNNNATNIACMFYECSSLKKLDLSNFNFYTNAKKEFICFGCTSLKELTLSSLYTKNVNQIWKMLPGVQINLI